MILSVGALAISRGVSTIVVLLSVPLTVGYLGNERYGLWLTLSSLVSMAGFADLGIGNGLRTLVAEADGHQDHAQLARLISSAIAVLTAVAAISIAAFLIAHPYIDSGSLFGNLTPETRREVPNSLLALVLTFLVAIPLQVAQSVQHGLQQGYAATL
ncbi:MAG TPA: hypothetical protein VIV60_30410, partial [Polyangiaceae bacterium]